MGDEGSNRVKGVDISVVVPLYRCSETVVELVRRLDVVLSGMGLVSEIILVNDRSPADDWARVKGLVERYPTVRGLSLSRNFGQHAAITAGLSKTRGSWVVVMDGDLQDVPEEIPALYAKALEGYDYVQAARRNRNDSWLKKLGSSAFYRVLGYLTDSKQDAEVANFGVYSRKVVDAVLSMGDQVKCFPVMVGWVGFRGCKIAVAHAKRELGKSAYSLRRMIRLATGVILGFSDKPLRLVIKFGLAITTMAAIYAFSIFIRALSGGVPVMGYSSLIVSIWGTFGVNMVVLGMIGMYLGRVFDQSKNRPVFVVDQEIECEGNPIGSDKQCKIDA